MSTVTLDSKPAQKRKRGRLLWPGTSERACDA